MDILALGLWVERWSFDFIVVLATAMVLAVLFSRRSVGRRRGPDAFGAGAIEPRGAMAGDGYTPQSASALALVSQIFQLQRARGSVQKEPRAVRSTQHLGTGRRLRVWDLARRGAMPTAADVEAMRTYRPPAVEDKRISIQEQFERLSGFIRSDVDAAYQTVQAHRSAARQLDAVDYSLISLRKELESVFAYSQAAEAALMGSSRLEPKRRTSQHRRLAGDRGPARSRIDVSATAAGSRRRRSRGEAA
ncbi:MAG: hypothetical protein AAFO75_04310 [Pseudomonadota bacterium]